MPSVKMRIWDVKHGNAIYIRTPNNKTIVIDLGRGDYSEDSDDRSPLETLRDHYGLTTIDYLVITHPHRDHIDDILNLKSFTVNCFHRPRDLDQKAILNNSSNRDREKFEKYFYLDSIYNASVTGTSHDITIPANYGGVSIKHFQTPHINDGNLNNRSIITVVEYEGLKVVIPGDNEVKSISELMENVTFRNKIKDCDILIAPHHGRESAYHAEFVTLANPRLSIISDGSLCETSANPKYTGKSRGRLILQKGKPVERKLLTTNCDGEIYIDFGRSDVSGKLFLNVKTK